MDKIKDTWTLLSTWPFSSLLSPDRDTNSGEGHLPHPLCLRPSAFLRLPGPCFLGHSSPCCVPTSPSLKPPCHKLYIQIPTFGVWSSLTTTSSNLTSKVASVYQLPYFLMYFSLTSLIHHLLKMFPLGLPVES